MASLELYQNAAVNDRNTETSFINLLKSPSRSVNAEGGVALDVTFMDQNELGRIQKLLDRADIENSIKASGERENATEHLVIPAQTRIIRILTGLDGGYREAVKKAQEAQLVLPSTEPPLFPGAQTENIRPREKILAHPVRQSSVVKAEEANPVHTRTREKILAQPAKQKPLFLADKEDREDFALFLKKAGNNNIQPGIEDVQGEKTKSGVITVPEDRKNFLRLLEKIGATMDGDLILSHEEMAGLQRWEQEFRASEEKRIELAKANGTYNLEKEFWNGRLKKVEPAKIMGSLDVRGGIMTIRYYEGTALDMMFNPSSERAQEAARNANQPQNIQNAVPEPSSVPQFKGNQHNVGVLVSPVIDSLPDSPPPIRANDPLKNQLVGRSAIAECVVHLNKTVYPNALPGKENHRVKIVGGDRVMLDGATELAHFSNIIIDGRPSPNVVMRSSTPEFHNAYMTARAAQAQVTPAIDSQVPQTEQTSSISLVGRVKAKCMQAFGKLSDSLTGRPKEVPTPQDILPNLEMSQDKPSGLTLNQAQAILGEYTPPVLAMMPEMGKNTGKGTGKITSKMARYSHFK